MSNPAQRLSLEPGLVLCEAFLSLQGHLGLTQAELGQVIGRDRSKIRRLRGNGYLDPESKEGELARYLIRIFRSLYAQMGGDDELIRHWLETPNRHLNGIPKEMLETIEGLVRVMQYLDAMRAKV